MKGKSFKKIRFTVIFNRTHRLNDDGTALIQIRAYHGGQTRYFSIGIYIEPQYWDDRNKRVKETHPAEIHYNQKIYDQLREFKTRELQMIQRFGFCPLRLLDGQPEEASLKLDPNLTFTEFFEQEIKRPELQSSTRRGHKVTLNYLRRFQETILFDDISYSFVSAFDKFLSRHNLGLNTIFKHHKNFKAYINLAIKHDYLGIDKNPYFKFKAKQTEPERIHLTAEELHRLEKLQIPEERTNGGRHQVLMQTFNYGYDYKFLDGDTIKVAYCDITNSTFPNGPNHPGGPECDHD